VSRANCEQKKKDRKKQKGKDLKHDARRGRWFNRNKRVPRQETLVGGEKMTKGEGNPAKNSTSVPLAAENRKKERGQKPKEKRNQAKGLTLLILK